MSYSDDFKQKFLELYQLKQSAMASSLHSNLAQPIVAAKNFAAAIKNMSGQDKSLLEAKKIAEYIVELSDQAYTVAYDLMIENEPDTTCKPGESMVLAVQNYAELLRFKKREITLNVVQSSPSISLDPFLNRVVLDWVKSILIYLARHSKASIIDVDLIDSGSGFSIQIVLNVAIDPKILNAEPIVINIREQVQVFDGSLLIESEAANDAQGDIGNTFVKIFLPQTTEILNTIK